MNRFLQFSKRFIAVSLATFLITESLAFAAPELGSPAKLSLGFDLPESVAVVEDSWKAPYSSKTIYLIQDAHTNTSGQINLSKTLDLLLQTHPQTEVFTEAGIGDNSLSFLRQFKSLAQRKQIAGKYLHQGFLHGAEYLDLTSDHAFTLWGVEDKTLYLKALENYKTVAKNRSKHQDYLNKIDQTIKILKSRIYNPLLLSLDESNTQYTKGNLTITQYLKKLTSNQDLKSYPHLKNLKKLQRLEQILEKQKKNYPKLSILNHYKKLSSNLQAKTILQELESLEKQAFDSLITTEDERQLFQASKTTDYLKKLLNLTLTPEEFEVTPMTIVSLTGFLNKKIMDLKSYYENTLFLDEGFEEVIEASKAFYHLTLKRDEAFIENMPEKLERGVLITGGYHTPNLKRLLKERNISYIVLTPTITHETNIKRYEQILLNQSLNSKLFSPVSLSQASATIATVPLAGNGWVERSQNIPLQALASDLGARLSLEAESQYELYSGSSPNSQLAGKQSKSFNPNFKKMVVVGAGGYVGSSESIFQVIKHGHDVIGVDLDLKKIDLLKKGHLPHYAPGMEDLLKAAQSSGRLEFVYQDKEDAQKKQLAQAIAGREYVYLAVPTPQGDDGKADVRYLEGAVRDIVRVLKPGESKILIGKSTAPPKTIDRLKNIAAEELAKRRVELGENTKIDFAWVPEFFREGQEYEDGMRGGSGRTVIGADDPEIRKKVEALYSSYNPEYEIVKVESVPTDIKTAMLIKYVSNAFRALKISFINFISWLTEKLGFDINVVADFIGKDPRILRWFLNVSLAFGGSCFPKDVIAFVRIAEELGLDYGLFLDILGVNRWQHWRFSEKILSSLRGRANNKTIVVLGASFKAGTDDIRQSPAIDVIDTLLSEGAKIRVLDPKAIEKTKENYKERDDVKYFDDASYLDTADKIKTLFVGDGELSKKASAIVIATEWEEFKKLDFESLREVFWEDFKKSAISPAFKELNYFQAQSIFKSNDNLGKVKSTWSKVFGKTPPPDLSENDLNASRTQFKQNWNGHLPKIFDGRNLFSVEQKQKIKELGFEYFDIGRGEVTSGTLPIDAGDFVENVLRTFLFVEVSFMNVVAQMADKLGANILDLKKGIKFDRAVGDEYKMPGLGVGGEKIKKGVETFQAIARHLVHADLPGLSHARQTIKRGTGLNGLADDSDRFELRVPFADPAVKINNNQIDLHIKALEEKLGGLNGKTVAVLGLGYKPNDSATAGSQSIKLIQALSDKNINVKVNAVGENANTSANARTDLKKEGYQDPNIFYFNANSPEALKAIAESDAVILATGSSVFKDWKKIFSKRKPGLILLDGRHFYDPKELRSAGIGYFAIGVPGPVVSGARLALNDSEKKMLEQAAGIFNLDPIDKNYVAQLWLQFKERVASGLAGLQPLKMILDRNNPKDDGNFIVTSLLTEKEKSLWRPVVKYDELKNDENEDEAKKIAIIASPLDGGIGESVLRTRELKLRAKRLGMSEEVIIKMAPGAKGTDLGYYLANYKNEFVSIAEFKLLKLIGVAAEKKFRNIKLQLLVNYQSELSYKNLLDKTICFYDRHNPGVPVDRKRTYRQALQESGIEVLDMIQQKDIPYVSRDGQSLVPDLSVQDKKDKKVLKQPGGHGQWGFRFLSKLADLDSPREKIMHTVRVFYNGDNTNSSVNEYIAGAVVRNKWPIVKLTTVAASIDKKGGKEGVRVIPKEGGALYIPDQMEEADAKDMGQVKQFHSAGQPGGLGKQGGQDFNTNMFYFNETLLRSLLVALRTKLGEDEFHRIISPALIFKASDNSKIKEGSDGKRYAPLDGAIGTVAHNLHRYFEETKSNPEIAEILKDLGVEKILYFVDVPRDEFFTPFKNAFDLYLQRSNLYGKNLNRWMLEKSEDSGELPEVDLISTIEVKQADGTVKKEDDKFWADTLNLSENLGDTTDLRKLTSLKIDGKVKITRPEMTTVLQGKVEIVNLTEELVDLTDAKYDKSLRESKIIIDSYFLFKNIRLQINRDSSLSVSYQDDNGARLTEVQTSEKSSLPEFFNRIENAFGPKVINGQKLSLLQNRRDYIFELKVENSRLIALAQGVTVKVSLDRSSKTSRRRAGAGEYPEVSISDIRLTVDTLENKIAQDLKDLEDGKIVNIVYDLDLLPVSQFEFYARHLLVNMKRFKQKYPQVFFDVAGQNRAQVLECAKEMDFELGLYSSGDSESDEVETIHILDADKGVKPEGPIELPAKRLEAGDIPVYPFEVASRSRAFKPGEVPQGYLNAYSTMAGSRLSSATISQVLNGLAGQEMVKQATLIQASMRAGLDKAIQFLKLARRMIDPSA